MKSKVHAGRLVAVLMTAMVVGCNTSPRFTATREADGARSGMIKFPEWSEQHPDGYGVVVCRPLEYFFRTRTKSGHPELLVRGGSYETAHCDECYAITLQDPFRVRQVALEDWHKGSSSPPREGTGIYKSDGQRLTYRGKTYQMKGKLWSEATLSPGKRWLFLRSYDDRDWIKIRSPISFDSFEPSTRGGPTYLQIYDTHTEELVFAAQTRILDEIVHGSAQWVGDAHVLQPNYSGERALFVALPGCKEKDYTGAHN